MFSKISIHEYFDINAINKFNNAFNALFKFLLRTHRFFTFKFLLIFKIFVFNAFRKVCLLFFSLIFFKTFKYYKFFFEKIAHITFLSKINKHTFVLIQTRLLINL